MDLGLRDATAVVVGGGRGMGLAAARCLAEDGARVALVGRTKEVLDACRRRTCGTEAVRMPSRWSPTPLTMPRFNEVFAELGDRWGGQLNILVNAVGPTVPRARSTTSPTTTGVRPSTTA